MDGVPESFSGFCLPLFYFYAPVDLTVCKTSTSTTFIPKTKGGARVKHTLNKKNAPLMVFCSRALDYLGSGYCEG